MSNRDNVLEKFRADGAWKDKADANIEKYRKGNAKITLTDSEGKPIENGSLYAPLYVIARSEATWQSRRSRIFVSCTELCDGQALT